jgi:hypothetical protein
MIRKSEHKLDDPAQYKRFLEAAKKAGADESEEGADRAFKKVAKGKAQPPKKN